MRTFIFYSFLACFVFTCAQGNAQSLKKIYSGKDSPTQTGWTELKMDKTISPATEAVATATPTVATVALPDGVLQLRSTTNAANAANAADQFSQLGWYKTDLKLNLQTGYTIEIKAKITDASKYGAFNIQGFDNFGKGFRIGIYKNALAESTNPLAATNVLKSGLTNDDKFHTYRITVNPDRMVTIYRDIDSIGTFPISDFYFDNIIENGGFEDGGDVMDNAVFFPDFRSNSLLYRTVDPVGIKKPDEGYVDVPFVHSGNYALIMNNDGKHEVNDASAYDPANSERARTRDIPVKTNTKYDISIARCRIWDRNWDWRDMGAFWDFQSGTQTGVDNRNDNALGNFPSANDNWWQIHNQTITTPAADAEKVAGSIRFEFPSWVRDGGGIKTAFDDFYIKENLGLTVGQEVSNMADPVLPDKYVNLIANGGFEDWTMNNDGTTPYEWALSNPDDAENNEPTAFNPVWNGLVRIQRNDKPNDEIGGQWAHSGQSSMRFTTLGNPSNRTFAFTKELEANKSYRFNFWHRNPHWGETAWLKVKVGDNVIWGERLGNDDNVWANADMTFTTTTENRILSLYLEDYCCDWYNFFLDDLVLIEISTPGPDPLLVGKENLIKNGDFENDMLGNDGKPYMWALASDFGPGDNDYPVAWSDVWGAYVRLQDQQKVQDTGLNWAHSGTKSLRISYLNKEDKTITGSINAGTPDALNQNINFQMNLDPDQTYTFVFWIKTANYNDKGDLMIANDGILLWKQQLSTKYINWSRQSVTFTTTKADHTLRMYTTFTSWCNFYLDDLFLYKEAKTTPLSAEDTYLFFGKSMGTESANVDIEYVAIDNTGTGIKQIAPAPVNNLKVNSSNSNLSFKAINPAFVQVYTITGQLVDQLNVKKEASIALPQGIYIVKSVSAGNTETIKVINK